MDPVLIIKAAKAAIDVSKTEKGRTMIFIALVAPFVLILALLSTMVYIITHPLSLFLNNGKDDFGIGNFKKSEEVLEYSAIDNYEAVKYTREIIRQGDRDIVYFNQNEKPWNNMLYGFLLPISVSGCGPTTMAMVISTLTGKDVIPVEAGDWSYNNGYLKQGYEDGEAYASTYHSFIPAIAKKYGLLCNGIGKGADTEEKLIEALSESKLVVAIMGQGDFTSEGHFIILTGINIDGKVHIVDSASRERTYELWSMSDIVTQAKGEAGAGGPFWAIYPLEQSPTPVPTIEPSPQPTAVPSPKPKLKTTP
jgi:hypothetical protein